MATKHVVMAYFAEKRKKTEIPIFDKKTIDSPFWKNAKFSTFLTQCFYSLKLLVFYMYKVTLHFVLAYFSQKEKRSKFPIFDQKPLTNNPFRKIQNFQLF